MEIDITKFNDTEYFKELSQENKIPVNHDTWDDKVSLTICDDRRIWVCTDASNVPNNLEEVYVEILGLRISQGVCSEGIYAVQAKPFEVKGLELSGYCPRIQGVWFATRPSQENAPGYDYYPIFFDKEFAQPGSISSYEQTVIRQWCRIKTTSN